MPTLLLTAFEPYDGWPENSSWLTLVELTKNLPSAPRLTTRRSVENTAYDKLNTSTEKTAFMQKIFGANAKIAGASINTSRPMPLTK